LKKIAKYFLYHSRLVLVARSLFSRFDCPHAGRKTRKYINSLPVWMCPARSHTPAAHVPQLLLPPSLHGSSVWRVDAREC
jgi:hypothetical protein